MDLSLLKKRISSYRGEGGRLRQVPDDLAMEILTAWEQFTGTASEFYRAIGVDYRKVASLMGRAKKLKREGYIPPSDFIEVKPLSSVSSEVQPALPLASGGTQGAPLVADLTLPDGIRVSFYSVSDLVGFLNRLFPEGVKLELHSPSFPQKTGSAA